MVIAKSDNPVNRVTFNTKVVFKIKNGDEDAIFYKKFFENSKGKIETKRKNRYGERERN